MLSLRKWIRSVYGISNQCCNDFCVRNCLSADNLSAENADNCSNLTLKSASLLLKNVLGQSSSTIYAIALLASGQSSTITGTYAGQYIMQMIVSFELPFALIPLLKFSSSSTKMGPHKNSMIIIVISWILLSLGVIGINVYYLCTAFVGWLIHNHLPKVANVFIGIIVFPLMAVYAVAIIYLIFRKDTVQTYTETKNEPAIQTQMEKGVMANGQLELSQVPYREDLADIPLPQ